MNKYFHNFLFGISVLPALLIMPAMATEAEIIDQNLARAYYYVEDGSSFSLINGIYSGNTSTASDTDYLNRNFGVIAFIDKGTELIVDNSTFQNNALINGNGWGGGALATGVSSNAPLLIIKNNSKFISNHSYYDGGAIGNYGGLIVENALFQNNTADYTTDANGDYTVLVSDSNPVGGGAISLGAVSRTSVGSIKNTLFEGNKSGTNGGAIGTRLGKSADNSGAKLDIAATFVDNQAHQNGGAIYNTFYANNGLGKGNGVTVTGNFIGNNAGNNGGAIYNDGAVDAAGNAGGVMTLKNSRFVDNTAGARGGAIYNSGTLTIDGANFETNSAYVGGAISVSADGTTNIKNTEFRNNSATMVGAIDNKGVLFVDNSKFIGNHANWWGAIMSGSDAVSATITNTLFQNNYAEEIGAVSLCSPEDNVLTNVQFVGNKATSTASDSDGAGALFLGAVSRTVLTNVTFNSNESNTHGGAISTRSADLADNSAAKVDIINSAFTGNKALTTGGALDNYLYSSVADVTAVYVENTGFVANSAANGGAIYNHGEPDRADGIASLSMKDVVFEGNTATVNGGAIYNASSFSLSGTNTFTGNTANGVANDIYNAGALNIKSGTTTIDGGIDGTGALIIAEGATLDIGTAGIVQDNITLNGTLLATLRSGVDAQLISGTDDDSFTGNGTLKLAIRGADTYHVFGEKTFANYEIESSVYDYQWANEGKDLIATMKSVEDIADENGLTTETAATVANLANSESGQLNDLAVAIQEKLAVKTDEARAEVERVKAAIHPETESVTRSVASSVQSTVTSLATGRMSMPTIGRNGGDAKMTSGGVWVQGIFNKSKQNDAFSGYTRGVAGGLDATFNKVATIGAGYAFAHSDMTGTERDTEIDSSTVFLYGQYKPSAWYVNAVANYTMADYTETGSALGIGLSANYDVDSFGANVATGYDFAGGVTPELALRYMHINSADYISSLGIKNELDDADYLTASIGTKYAFDMKVSRRLNLRPELRYGVKYDVLSDKQVATVTMPGVNSYVLDTGRLSRIGGEFGIGLTMNYRGLDMSLNYDIEAREDYTSQSGRVKFRYNF